MADLGGDSLA